MERGKFGCNNARVLLRRTMCGGYSLSAYNHYRARAAEYQQRAKNARNEDDKFSLLALAESWLQTAELCEQLTLQEGTFTNP
jgi:hypothetical protein